MGRKMFSTSATVTKQVWSQKLLGLKGLWAIKEKNCHIYTGAGKNLHLVTVTFSMCVSETENSPPVHLSSTPGNHPPSGMQTDTVIFCLNIIFKPLLDSQRGGNIRLISHLHDFLYSSDYNLWNDGNSTFLLVSQQVGEGKCVCGMTTIFIMWETGLFIHQIK